MSRRILRYFLFGLVLLVLGGLWAFSFFLFNPFEGAYEYPLAGLISREVDFYVAKNGLERDFDPFPKLPIQDAFVASPAGQAILELGLGRVLEENRVEAALQELERALAQVPIHVDPLAVFGGRGLACAGNFAGSALTEAKWVVLGRANWLGKLALELVMGGWLDLAAQGLTLKPFAHEGKAMGVELSGDRLPRPLFLGRIQDVVMVASAGEFLAQAFALETTRGQDSLDRSAKYTDNIVRTARPNDELELYVDQRALGENLKLAGTWPDPNSPDVATALCAKLFQLGALREWISTLDFAQTVSLDGVGELSPNALSPFQERLYGARGFDKEQMLEAARLVLEDAGLYAYVHADIGDLLRQLRSVYQNVDPAAVTNIEDFARTAFNLPDLDRLIDEIDAGLRDRVAFFVRNYDYPAETGERAPPHDQTPVLAWALILWQDEANKDHIETIRRAIVQPDVLEMLRIQGATPGTAGVWDNTLQGGAHVKEYWNVFIPGTGHLAVGDMKGRDSYLVISNENRLVGQIFKAYTTGKSDEGLARLADQPAFQTWVGSGLGSANFMAWFAPRPMTPTLRRIAAHEAGMSGADFINWKVERPRIEREVLVRDFPGLTVEQLSTDQQNAFEGAVQSEVDRFQASFLQKQLPTMQADSERWLRALSALSGSFLEVAADRKRLRLQARFALDFGAKATP